MSRTLLGKMTPGAYGNILARLGKVVCQLCREPMEKNCNYVRVRSARNSKAKSYHLQCAERVNIVFK